MAKKQVICYAFSHCCRSSKSGGCHALISGNKASGNAAGEHVSFAAAP